MRFDELDLEEAVLDGLDAMNFLETTPVQELTIPVILEGKDIIACAQTGTGKTAAYVLPVINELSKGLHPANAINAIIMAPTRELAQQIDQQIEGFTYFVPVSAVAVYGGTDGIAWEQQKRGMEMGADIVIATPGRLLSHIKLGTVDLSQVSFFVLDEADRMLDMGFYDDIMQVYKLLPATCQTIMFSATMPPKIRTLAQTILKNPEEVKIAISRPPETIMQTAYVCYDMQKLRILEDLFSKSRPQRVIIFSSSKMKVKELASTLKRMKFNVAAMHSDLEQSQREEVMKEFKNGRIDILVATDVVSRGIDINDIKLVINFDIPHDPEDYVHRIGRTARAGADGTAVSFCAPEEQEYLAGIEKLNRRKIPVVSGHPWDGVPAPVRPEPPVRGKKPKAAAAEPAEKPAAKQPKPAKAEAKNAKPEKKAAPAPKVQAKPAKTEKEEPLMDDTKRTTGGRSNDRRSNNNSRPRREQNAPARGSNAQPKFDPHFVSAPEATPLRPAKKTPAAPAAPAIRTAAQPAQQNSSMQGQKSRRNDRSDRPARQNSQPAAQSQSAEQGRGANNGQRGRQNASRNAQPAPARAPRAESSRRGRAAAARDEDPGLMLISRRPPQQKFTNFEEYMNAHGGATAPIEDHSDEV